MGGIDLCFGRWDTPQHILVDDPQLNGGDKIWPGNSPADLTLDLDSTRYRAPGKDYSNPRVIDFHTLHKPFEDLYDRERVPRMPWLS
jgi:phospholipase D1/2